MNTYAIRRNHAWASPVEVQQVAARSKEVADNDFPTDIKWIRSYVIAEANGSLGSICIYQATNHDAVREHARRVGMPADDIQLVAETVIIRPDPVGETTTP